MTFGRAARAFGALAVTLVLGVGLSGGPARARPEARAMASIGRPWLGVDLADAGRLPDAADVRALAALGVRRIRVDVRWADLEPEPGRVAWDDLDGLVRSLDAVGVGWVARVHASPRWARRDPEPPAHWWLCRTARPEMAAEPDAAPPTDPADLAAFAAALATRYANTLTAIEVWREPNLMPNWRAGGPDPEDYGRLLLPVAQAVHRARPDMRVVSAALAPTTELHPCAMDDVVFLGRLARSGGLAAVDAVGIAPLGMRALPDALPDPDALGVRRAELHRRVLERAGVLTPLWALSFGWAAGEADDADAIGRGAVPPERAAAYLEQAWVRAARDWPWLEAGFVWGVALDGDEANGRQPLVSGGRASPLAEAIGALAAGEPGPPAQGAGDEAASSEAPATGRAGLRRGSDVAPRLAMLVAGVLLALGCALVAVRRRDALGAIVRQLTAWPRSRSLGTLAAGYAGATVVLALSAGCPASTAICPAVLPWPFGVAALVALAWLATASSDLATAAVAAAAPFAFAGRLAIGPIPVATVELLVALAVGGRILACFAGLEPPRRPRFKALDAAVVVLVVWAAASPLWAPRPSAAWREWRTVLLEPALFYALLRLAPDARRIAQMAFIGLAGGATLAALLGLAQVLLGMLGLDAGVVVAEGVLRARGPYGSPNNLALLLGRVAMLLAAASFAPGVAPRVRRTARGALAVVSAGLLATFSRGAVLLGIPAGAAVVGLCLAPRRRWRMALVGLLGALAVMALLLIPFAGSERVAGALSAEPGSTGYYRLHLWRSAARMIQDHPLRGVGLDGFLYAYREVYVARDVIQERFLNHPHDVVLDWWTRLGLPGLFVLLWLGMGHLDLARRLARRGARNAIVAGALGMQAYGIAHGLVDNSFFLVDLAIVTWLAQAALLAELDQDAATRLAVDRGTASAGEEVGPPGFEPGTYRL